MELQRICSSKLLVFMKINRSLKSRYLQFMILPVLTNLYDLKGTVDCSGNIGQPRIRI